MPMFLASLLPVLSLMALLAINVFIFHGDPHIPLILAACVAAIVALLMGQQWKVLERGMIHSIQIAIKPILILLVVGALIGLWILAGIVPLLVYYGLLFLSPNYFLPAACLLCAVVSLSIGSSWSTAGTIGVALMAVGHGLGFPAPLVAGAIISGAYFGDKMSPLSDTTNLSPAVAGSELIEHIRHMVYSTMPPFVLAVLAYAVIGALMGVGEAATGQLNGLMTALQDQYNLSPLLLLVPLLVFILVMLKVDALPALIIGSLAGALAAGLFQGASLQSMFAVAQNGLVMESTSPRLNELLSRGGVDSMYWTVGLIICSMVFGGIMEASGMLHALAAQMLRVARSARSVVAAVVLSAFGTNVLAPDQYLSIVVPGRMFRPAFDAHHLHRKNLSRALEDGGTVTSPLIYWNTCGAYMGTVLGVSAVAYAPYAFFNLMVPIMSIILAFTGWTIVKAEPAQEDPSLPDPHD